MDNLFRAILWGLLSGSLWLASYHSYTRKPLARAAYSVSALLSIALVTQPALTWYTRLFLLAVVIGSTLMNEVENQRDKK